MKKTVKLEAIDPIEIYGVGNKILLEFCSYFPHLKVVARGNELILEGSESDIAEFNIRFAELIDRRHHKMNLTVYDVEDIFSGTGGAHSRPTGEAVIVHGTDGKPIRARNKTQQDLVKAYFENDLVFAVGPAGTGKTYMAIALAVRALKNREIKRIILTRPAVEAGERLGFLPGDLKEKLDPYLQPLYDALSDMIPSKRLQEFMNEGTIQIAPLAYMRGRTLDKACVILDEAQNTNLGQLKMFLTRMGMSAKFIVTGDATQVDLPRKEDSGLLRGIELVKDLKGVASVFFDDRDIADYSKINDSMWKLLEKGEITREELRTRRFLLFLERYGNPVDPAVFADLYMEMLSQTDVLLDGARELLEYLSENYRLYAVTNGYVKTQTGRIRKADIGKYFKDIFISQNVGAPKPQKKFFDYCAAHIPAFSIESTVLIGDSPTSDISGGNEYGIFTIRYNPKKEANPVDKQPKKEVYSLKDIPNLLLSL